MKYNTSNKPLVCMQTQSRCYKRTTTMNPVGVLWHSTGANNPALRRYVQPSDVRPAEDTYSKAEWEKILGKNSNKNDWNHIEVGAGLNCWIGYLADNKTVTTIQTMPWNYRPWGCGTTYEDGPSCNDGWMQFEICEDNLNNKTYFDAVYKEACEITAYYCKMYNIDPHGTVTRNGKKIPTILCHADSYKLGFGSNHADVLHWFGRYGKTMEDVRNDVAKLLTASGSSQTTQATVKTYQVVTTIPIYDNSADAKAKKNSIGTYDPGTYYIYTKYPSGYNGMFNITENTAGNTAGAWINPAENTVPVKEEVQKLYRVRTSWTDAKSQKGAFSSLENAKTCCQTSGAGYKVFDWEGTEVYAYVAPTPETKPEQVVPEVTQPVVPEAPKEEKPAVASRAVYDLEYPEKHIIVDDILSDTFDKEACTKAIVAIKKNHADFNVEIAKAFFTLAPKYDIDPMRAIAQSILETGWFKFAGSSVKPDQNNYCGLGATGGGVAGASFSTIEDGVRAQLQHLFAYGCKDELPEGESLVDPRFKYVTRGIAPYWEQLAGRWAVPGFDGTDAEAAVKAGNTYGQKIDKLFKQLTSTSVTSDEIETYFRQTVDDPAQSTPTPTEPVKDDKQEVTENVKVDVTKVNFILGILEKLLTAILKLFIKNDK